MLAQGEGTTVNLQGESEWLSGSLFGGTDGEFTVTDGSKLTIRETELDPAKHRLLATLRNKGTLVQQDGALETFILSEMFNDSGSIFEIKEGVVERVRKLGLFGFEPDPLPGDVAAQLTNFGTLLKTEG